MLSLALTVFTGAAAFSPPPVPTGTLPAGAARSFPDATVATGGGTHGGTPLEQAVLLNEQEQKQEQLLSPEARASGLGGPSPTREFLEWFGEDDSVKEGEGTIEVEGESSLEQLAEFLEAEARATTVAESLKAEGEDWSYLARVEFLEAKFLGAEEEGEAEEGEGTLEEYESYLERLAAFIIEAEVQEEGEVYSGEEEGEGALEEEGELVLGPIESYGEKEEEGESYAGDVKEKARATAVAEFLKQAEEEDGSYEARMDEFLEAMVIATNQVQLPQPEAEEGDLYRSARSRA